jgi:hypothetical protein
MADNRRRSAAPILAIALILLPIAYVLSIGPVIGAYNRGQVPLVVLKIYRPLGIIGTAIPPFGKLLTRYIDLWK